MRHGKAKRAMAERAIVQPTMIFHPSRRLSRQFAVWTGVPSLVEGDDGHRTNISRHVRAGITTVLTPADQRDALVREEEPISSPSKRRAGADRLS